MAEKKLLKPVVVKVGGVELDFSKAVPMQQGDWIALAKMGVKFGPMTNIADDPVMQLNFVLWFAQKILPTIQRDDVAALPVMRSQRIIKYLYEASQEDDDDPN